MHSEHGPVSIREATAADAVAIAAIYAPYVTGAVISFETIAPDAVEMERRRTAGGDSHPWLVCERGGEVAGYAYASEHRPRAAYRWSVEVSAYVRAAHHRIGIGRGLYTALLMLLTAQARRVALGGITLPNAGSVGLHEALGFERVALYPRLGHKFGGWHDVGWWQRELGDPDADSNAAVPTEPIGLAALRERPEFVAALRAGAACVGRPGL